MTTETTPSGLSAAISGLKFTQDSISRNSQDIANIESNGFKRFTSASTASIYGGVYDNSYRRISESGIINADSSSTALAIIDGSNNGKGMFAVANSAGQMFYAPTGNFPLNKESVMELQGGGYFLQGWEYDNSSASYIKSLSNIEINRDLRAKATDEIKIGINLSGEVIAESDGGTFTINVNNTNSSELISLGSQYLDTSFEINKTIEIDGQIKSQTMSFTFGGISQKTFTPTATTINAAAPTGSFQIVVDGLSLGSIKATEIYSTNDTDSDVFDKLQTKMKSFGLRCDIVDDGATDKKIIFAPQDANSSMRLVPTGDLLSTLGLKPTNILQDGSTNSYRFASVKELADAMESKGFNVWSASSNASQLVVSSPKNYSVSLYTDKTGGTNLLYALGAVSSSDENTMLIENSYDPYKPELAIANNKNVISDLDTNFIIYDSLGNKHIMYASFMRLNGYDWAMEVYCGNPQEVDGTVTNGLVQASRISFDMNGNLSTISSFSIPIYSNTSQISSPFQDIGNTGDTFVLTSGTISKTYTQGTDFLNMTDLVSKINTDFQEVKASIISDPENDGVYSLKIVANNPNVSISTSGDAATALGMSPAATNIIPSLNKTLQVKWKGTNGAAPEESKIRFSYNDDQVNCISSLMRAHAEGNGYKSGSLSDIEISGGIVTGIYDNGQRIPLYKIPVAICNNINKMNPADKGLFQATEESGEIIMVENGQGGAGKIFSKRIEGSNVELPNELTELAISSKYYEANAGSARTIIGMLDALQRLVG